MPTRSQFQLTLQCLYLHTVAPKFDSGGRTLHVYRLCMKSFELTEIRHKQYGRTRI